MYLGVHGVRLAVFVSGSQSFPSDERVYASRIEDMYSYQERRGIRVADSWSTDCSRVAQIHLGCSRSLSKVKPRGLSTKTSRLSP